MTILGYEIKRKEKAPMPSVDGGFWGGFSFTPGMSTSEMLRNNTISTCVNLISDNIAGLPCDVYKKLDTGSRVRDDNHALEKVLKFKPNFYQNNFTFKKMIMQHLLLKGNSFCFLQRNSYDGSIEAMYPLEPDNVEIKARDDKPNEFVYIYTSAKNGSVEVFTQDNILHISAGGYSGVRGLSPLESASGMASLDSTLNDYMTNVFSGTLHNKIHVNVPKEERNFTKEERNKLEERIEREYAPENAKKPLITTGGLTVSELNATGNSDILIDARKFTSEQILAAFRVPRSYMGDTDQKYSNAQESNRVFLQNCLTPWLRILECAFNELFTPGEMVNHYIEFNVDALLKSNYEQRVAGYSQMLSAGIMSINEIRKAESMPLLDGENKEIGDMHFISTALLPATKERFASLSNNGNLTNLNKDKEKKSDE